ncbi:MAG: META domain-containing protein [Desulfobacterales bacterium]
MVLVGVIGCVTSVSTLGRSDQLGRWLRVGGNVSCNCFPGSYVLFGLNLSFWQLATTKRICTDSLDQPVVQISERCARPAN